MADLTVRETAMLDLERQVWGHAGSKQTAILDLFGCRETRYYSELRELIARPEALLADPVMLKRLDAGLRRQGAMQAS